MLCFLFKEREASFVQDPSKSIDMDENDSPHQRKRSFSLSLSNNCEIFSLCTAEYVEKIYREKITSLLI